jgi:hypothetical protein
VAANWDETTGKGDAGAGGDPGGTGGNPAAAPPGENRDQSGASPTGSALVPWAGQAGSALVPRADQAGPVAAAPVVKYEFPVEITLVGKLDGAMIARIAELVFAKFDRELSSRL